MFFLTSSNLFLTIKNLMFNDINQGLSKQVMGTEKVWSFSLAFSDNVIKVLRGKATKHELIWHN